MKAVGAASEGFYRRKKGAHRAVAISGVQQGRCIVAGGAHVIGTMARGDSEPWTNR